MGIFHNGPDFQCGIKKSILTSNMKKTGIIFFGVFISLAASRLVPHPPNFTSLIALSFYIPALLGIRYLPALLLSFAITDFFIGFHSTLIFTWGSIITIGLLSKYFTKRFTSACRIYVCF